MSEVESGCAAQTILRVAGKIRALSNRGLHFADNPYEIENYEQMLALCAELTALVDARPLPLIRRRFFDDRRYVTPYTVVDTAVFDESGRILLIRRKDSGRWALPGGWCEVGDLPGDGAAREVWEETGCRVALRGLLGVFDNNRHGGGDLHHLYCLLYAAQHLEGEPIVTSETLGAAWFSREQTPWDDLHAAHAPRVRCALWLAGGSCAPGFLRPARVGAAPNLAA